MTFEIFLSENKFLKIRILFFPKSEEYLKKSTAFLKSSPPNLYKFKNKFEFF